MDLGLRICRRSVLSLMLGVIDIYAQIPIPVQEKQSEPYFLKP